MLQKWFGDIKILTNSFDICCAAPAPPPTPRKITSSEIQRGGWVIRKQRPLKGDLLRSFLDIGVGVGSYVQGKSLFLS